MSKEDFVTVSTESTHLRSKGFDPMQAAARLSERGLGGMLLTNPESVYYATGYPCVPGAGNPVLFNLKNRLPAFAYVDVSGAVTLLCWGFSTMGLTFGVDEIVRYEDLSAAGEAVRTIARDQLGSGLRLGIESTCPYFVLKLLEQESLAAARLELVDDLVLDLRLVKSAEEVEVLTRGLAIAEAAVADLFEVVRVGMNRADLVQEAKRRVAERGGTAVSHVTIGFGNRNPEIAYDDILEPDTLVTLDVGATVDGYCSDNRRYVHAGEIPEAISTRYEAMVGVVDDIGGAITPGMTYADLFEHGRQIMIDRDILGHQWLNHVGHNIGLELEEDWIDNRADAVIRENMVLAIELYTITEQVVVIGNEETYHVGPTGARRLSQLPREIHQVG